MTSTPPYGLVLRAADRRPYILVNVSDPTLPDCQKLAPEFDLFCGSAQGHSQWGARTKVLTGLWMKTVEVVRGGLKKRHVRVIHTTRTQNIAPFLVTCVLRHAEDLCKITDL